METQTNRDSGNEAGHTRERFSFGGCAFCILHFSNLAQRAVSQSGNHDDGRANESSLWLGIGMGLGNGYRDWYWDLGWCGLGASWFFST